MKLKRESFKAVFDEEIEPFLEKLGLLESILDNKIKCIFCGDIISIESFGGVYKKKKTAKLMVFCNKSSCYLEALKNKDV